MHRLLFMMILGFIHTANAQEDRQATVTFTPPMGWHFAEKSALPASVKVMVVGKGKHEFPPSLNLTTENYKGTLQEYLKVVHAINDSQGSQWQDLGTIDTKSGKASLSQVDTETPWGKIRMMHVILVRDEQAYILTASALKEEFPQFYPAFFTSLQSLSIP